MEKETESTEIRPGQDIIVIGYIGLLGTAKAAAAKETLLSETLPWDLLEDAKLFGMPNTKTHISEELLMEILPENTGLFPVKEGGIFAALWEMSGKDQIGFSVMLRKIPVKQETIEICEVLDFNPYELLSGSCYIAVVDNGYDLLSILEQREIPAVWIGKISTDKDKKIINGENCRYLNRPEPDAIEKLNESAQKECAPDEVTL